MHQAADRKWDPAPGDIPGRVASRRRLVANYLKKCHIGLTGHGEHDGND
jgi:hypothetical protein